jgi:hypothetical protein
MRDDPDPQYLRIAELEHELARLDDMNDIKVIVGDYTRCRDCNRIFDMCQAEDWGYAGELGYWTDDACVCPDCEVKTMKGKEA